MNSQILYVILINIIITFAQQVCRPIFTNRVVGGYQTSIEVHPYQVSLQKRGVHVCGGSIIGSEWVLTASHCVDGAQATDISVRVASSNHRIGGKVVNASQIIKHENYNRFTIDYDYALIKLKYSLPANSKKIKAVILPRQDEELDVGSILHVSGWGVTQNDDESRVILRATSVPYVDHELCNEAYKIFGGITEQMICAGWQQGGKDACQGDSGGPLVFNSTLYGVVSWGFDCAQPSYPGVYAKVSAIRDWIRDKTDI